MLDQLRDDQLGQALHQSPIDGRRQQIAQLTYRGSLNR